MGRDADELGISPRTVQFQSTLPVWGETKVLGHERGDQAIPIHSPHTGRDELGTSNVCDGWKEFQSPLLTRGETAKKRLFDILVDISIPSPHTGRDLPMFT